MSKKVNPQICPECKKLCSWFTGIICHNCYRQKHWKRKLYECKLCKKMKPHKALGLCATCYIKTYHYDEAKAFNIMKWHNISLELYREITKKCLICGFDKAIHLHHLDKNHNNSSRENLIGLCPNHHEMIHMYEYEKELTKEVQNALAVLPS